MTVVSGRQRRNKPAPPVRFKPAGAWTPDGSGRSKFAPAGAVADTSPPDGEHFTESSPTATAPNDPATAEEAGNGGEFNG